jgi:CRISPR-associated protein Csb2
VKPSLCVSFRFIQPLPLFHGRGDAEKPEWPPSPMRAFQALLNAACLRTRGRPLPADARSALYVLEGLLPLIIASRATLSSTGHRAYVPHNQADLVTAAWDRGNVEASIASHRIEKDYRPHRIETVGDDLPTVHYLYSLETTNADPKELLNAIRPSVRSIHCLGWGVDQVVADAVLVDSSSTLSAGETWTPTARGGQRLRVHRKGSLDALTARHGKFLTRLVQGDWTPVPPLTAFEQVRYRRDTDTVARPHAVFKLLDANEDPARYPHARLVHIAGMVRHVAIEAMTEAGADADFVNRFIRGKRDAASGDEHKQISYVPLPSIGHAHADGMIRNIMLVAPIGMERELADVALRIDGVPLKPEGNLEGREPESLPTDAYGAELRRFTSPKGKFIDTRYLGTSRVWQTVTPVILDGHDDKKPGKTIRLIQIALQRAGIETPCEFTWQSLPFFRNCLSAHKYDRAGRHTGYHRPAHLKDLTAVHVRIEFAHPVPGPLTLGAGRHCGLGLMAVAD